MKVNNQKGQMAVFIALFFQVLFVFFAMAINVGLVVHDKINLQNAVDLAAYYGATKQAEILNQIGHINYQMRQNYKLFVYRFRVLGSMGLDTHPYNSTTGPATVGGETPADAVFNPGYCVAHRSWKEYFDLDAQSNICRNSAINLPNIPSLTGGTGIVPGFSNLRTFVETTRAQFVEQCLEAGIFNWLVAARMLAQYRIDGATRKEMINNLSNLLTQPGSNFQDLRGESVQDGVEKTLRNNLTVGNNNDSLNIQFFNSMGEGGCNSRNQWLPEVQLNPVIKFINLQGQLSTGCIGESLPNRMGVARTTVGPDSLPSGFANAALASRYMAPNQILIEHWNAEPDATTSNLHSSIGFEKNPWCMVYSGVTVSTKVRKPFSPLGQEVELSARGFAKPFGGRIGPWYGKTWPTGSPNSLSSAADRTDPLLPSRSLGGAVPSGSPDQDLANHSRFPGDPLGMNSLRAVTSMINQARSRVGGDGSMAWANYNHIGGGPSFRSTGDGLARDATVASGASVPAAQRMLELGATAPDAFDAYYYSVEPRYFDNYLTNQTTRGGATLPPDRRVYDFGSSKDGYANAPQEFGIMESISNGQTMTGGAVGNYLIRDWKHLLTGWHQESSVTFGLSTSRFGACSSPVTNRDFPTTGNCVVGGRVGYSVKSVSRNYLLSSDHALGADSGSAGIINPPIF